MVLPILDSIIINDRRIISWIFTANDGKVKRRKSERLNEAEVLKYIFHNYPLTTEKSVGIIHYVCRSIINRFVK